jgi:hypothetical protein
MKIYLVTYGKRQNKFDPSLTEEGVMQIAVIRENLLPKIPLPPLVVIGTGTRFWDTYVTLGVALKDIPKKRSPFCGSGDVLEKDGTVAMAKGTVPFEDYIGLAKCQGFDAWEFLRSLTKVEGKPPLEGILLCAGEELMDALDLKSDKGQLYELNTETRSCRQIT